MIKKILLLIYGLCSIFWLQAQSPGGVSTNLVGWYSADVSATATTWTDRSTQGNNLTGTGSPTFTNLLNFNKVATFDGISQRYSITTTTASWPGTNTANTYYYVALPRGTNASRFVFGKGTGTTALNGMHSGKGTTATTLVSGATGTGTVSKASVWAQNVPTLVRTGYDGSPTLTHYISNNNTAEQSAGSSNPTYAATSAFAIGSQNTSAGFWDGDIAEVIVYSAKHAPGTFNRIQSYLALKYGINIKSNYINSTATAIWTSNQGYDNNIAGIARDDASGLNQKQSQSVESGIQPVIGNGNIFDTNANNTNNFSANLSSLIWGSDAGSTNFATAFAFGGLNNRMTRIWRVQETGTVGTVKVALAASDLSGNITLPTLLVSSDAVFNGSDTRTAMTLETLGGIQYYTATVDFTSGQFFTFAAFVAAPGGVNGNLQAWVKADAGVSTISGAVSSWNDQSGNGNNFSEATNRPVYNTATNLINFNPGISFNGSNHQLTNSTFAINQSGASIFAIGKMDAISSSWQSITASGTAASGSIFRVAGSVLHYKRYASNPSQYTLTAPTVLEAATPYLFETHSATGTNNSNLYINGRLDISGTTSVIPTPSLFTSIGVKYVETTGDYFQGNLPEIIYYSSVLNATERVRVESYLALKYGTTLGTTSVPVSYLATNGTVTWTGNATYQNNIAGIARDDASALNQKQSQSQNSGIQPVIGNGNIFDTNANNTNNFSADLSALVWGSDTGSTNFATSFVFGGLNNRMTRIWRVQETGTVGTVKVALLATDLPPNAASPTLVVSADAVFDGTDTRTTMTLETLGGIQYYTATVDFTTGQFFTFAALITAPGGISAELWLKADTGTSSTINGSGISQWNDQSGNSNNVAQGTAGNQPSYFSSASQLVNFNPVVKFDGTNDELIINSLPASASTDNTLEVVAVGFTTDTSLQAISHHGPITDNSQVELLMDGTTDIVLRENCASCSNSAASYTTITGGIPSIVGFNLTNGTTNLNSLNVYKNLRVLSSPTTSISGAANITSTTLIVGSRRDDANVRQNPFNGSIPEYIIFQQPLSSLERARVYSYAAIKYGVTLDQTTANNYLASDGTTILWNGTSNAAYNKNIAGLGRDDLSALYQKQSQSVNTGSQVVMALGTVAATNQANANTIPTDKQFFMWGDDNGSLSNIMVTGNTTYPYRFTRVWKTQNTGSFAQNMTVHYPVSAFGNAPASTVALLYGTSAASLGNGTASAIVQGGTTAINGVSYYAFAVPSAQVANMQFFSFTGTQTAPGGVIGANLWLKADTGTSTTTDGGAMSQWDDQSGNVNNVSQATEANKPLYRSNSANQMNFNPTVSFDGASDFMDATTFTINGSANTLFSAVKPNVVNVTQDILGFGAVGTNNGGEFRFVNATLQYGQNNGTYVPITSGSVLTAGTPLLFGSSMENAANGANLYQNNRNITTGTIGQIPSAANLVSIGSRTIGSRALYFNGFIPEVITYNTLLTAAERRRVNTYLSIKYGITMDQTAATDYLASDGTTILWNGTSNVTYNKNIAGISRDDFSALNQKQSQSVNSGIQPVIGNVNIAATNAANANNFSADLSALVWGSDTGSTSFATSFVFGGLNNRMTRIWKVQETGTVGTVKVALPVSQFAPNVSQLNLVVSSDAVFDGTDTRTAMTLETLGGVQYYTATVDFTSGQFFTFAALVTAPGGVVNSLTAWLRADNGTATTTNGAANNSWTNLVDGSVSNGGTATYSSNNINFNPGLSFNGTSNGYFWNVTGNWGLQGSQDFSTFALLRTTSSSTQTYFSPWATGSTQFYLSSANSGLYATDIAPVVIGSAAINDGIPRITGANRSGNFFQIRTNSANDGASVNNAYSFASTATQLGVGYHLGTGQYFNGNINEFITYAGSLSATEQQRINSYLAIKYGITLNQSVAQNYLSSNGITVLWDATANTGYNNNIAGIARDDASALYQKQSQSVNSGSQVVMAIGTFAASNLANANTISTDNQFFIWGNNNGSLTTQVATGNNTYTYRFTRIWKTQNTGSFAENMTVYYPVSAFGNALPATVALLYGTTAASLSNGIASAIAQSGTTSINGVSYYTFTVPSAQVANMQFFSFTGTQAAPGGVLSGLNLWVKADAGTSTTTDNTGLTTWNDQSGNAMNGTGIGSPLYRAGSNSLSPNFNPTVSLNGTSQGFSLPSGFSDFTAGTTGFVHLNSNFGTVDSYGRIFHLGTNNGAANSNFNLVGFYRILTSNTLSSAIFNGIDNANAQGSVSAANVLNPANGYTIMGFDIGAGTSGQTGRSGSIFSNGLTVATTNAHVTPYTGTRSFNYIGTSPINEYMNGLMSEVILYNSQLTTVEKLRVSSYLAIKYGNTLSNDNNNNATSLEVISGAIKEGDYVASDGTTIPWTGSNTYQNNIAGIGRDDLTALYQKQSQSVNTGSQVVMALGTVAASNQANANTIPTDKQFFIWGDDNGSLTSLLPTGLTPGRPQYRFTRVWKTQNTGAFAQNITVYYPVSAFGNAPASTVALLYGTTASSLSNGTANYILQGGTTMINGVNHYTFTFSSIFLSNMQFFSFTGTQTAPGGIITGLRQWLKADAGTSTTTAGSGVATWSDQSGNGFDALQSSAALAPLYRTAASANKYNFNPYLDYSGGKGSYNAGTSAAIFNSDNDNASIFVMSQGYTTGGTGVGSPWAVGFNTSGTTYLDQGKFGFSNSSTSMIWTRASGSTVVASSGLDDQSIANQIYVVDWNGATSTTKSIRARQNGKIVNSAANTNPLTIGTNTTNQFGISDGGNGSIVGDNNMGTFFTSEMIAYNTQLTELEMSRVNSYLAIKYGKTLSRDNNGNGTAGQTVSGSILEGDYVASDGTTRVWNSDAVYLNNIAGIGRDDISALNQKQSQSVNSGSQVVMALGTAAASNQANANTIATDKQFFIWGDDNGSITSIVSTGNGTYSYRLTRIWKTQNTGSFAENITVYYPVAAFGSAPASTVALLYGTSAASLSNGTASAIAQGGTTSINGASYYTFTVPSAQVANMQFFSFTGTQAVPGGVTGESLWLRADAGTNTTTNGAAITTWNDQALNPAITTQPTKVGSGNITYATGSMNFNPTINFDGTSGTELTGTTSAASTWSGALTVYGIARANTLGSGSQGIFASGTKGLVYSNNQYFIDAGPGGCATGGTGTVTLGSSNLAMVSYDADVPTATSRSYLNGRYRANFTPGACTASPGTGFEIGGRTIGSQPTRIFNGSMGEVIIYNSQQTGNNLSRLAIESYLGIKYGITLTNDNNNNSTANEIVSGSTREGDYIATDGTVTWSGQSNASYSNNIAGIGRDDLTALYQKQSRSQNSGSQVVMALGTAAASNQANANTIPTDKQFFIWGDDNGSLSNVLATGNTTYPYRFTRVWKTQNTGTFAQNMTVYYPVSAFGNAPASTVALLYGTTAASLSNGTASAIAQGGTTSINGASYYTFTVPSAQVANMQFFSFAGTQTAPGGVMDASLWIRADAGTSTTVDGGSVTTWTDQSGKGNNLVQNNSSFKPTYAASAATMLNYNPVVSFDGTQFTNVPFAASEDFTAGMSIFTVHKYLNATADGGLLSLMSGSNTDVIRIGRDNTNNFYALQTYNGSTAGPVINTAAGSLLTGNYNFLNWNQQAGSPGATVTATVSFSGLQQLATSSIVPSISGSRLFSAIGISPNFDYFNGHLPEIILYNRDLSSTQQERVNSYIAIKYGFTLVHNYVASDGTTTTYDVVSHSNNIAGIGRDDLTALYQKQSQSQNTGSQVVVALGTAAASNQANANTIPTDKQLFVWGDNNGSLTTFVSTGNVTYPSRFTRNWKIRNTGSFAQDITVYFPVSAFGTSLASSVALLYGPTVASLNDGSALAIPQSGTTTINGVSYYAFNVSAAQIGGFQQFFSFTGNSICYKPAATVGTTLDAKHGITALSRAGTSGDNWPMVRKGAWTVLEAKTKGFVINRLTAAQIAAIPAGNLVEGMMVYDTTNNCMKVYTSTDGGTTFSWQCITTQTCPD